VARRTSIFRIHGRDSLKPLALNPDQTSTKFINQILSLRKTMEQDKLIYDKHNMKKVLLSFPKMIREAKSLGQEIKVEGEIKNIFILGMGGSGRVGDILQNHLYDSKVPIFVVKDYEIPSYCDRNSLIFAVSYSGNTEELISAYKQAWNKGCRKIVSISSGGKLMELANLNQNFHIKVPSGIQPRLSTPYLFIPILNVLVNSGIIKNQEEIIEWTARSLEKPEFRIQAQELVNRIKGKVPIIYSSQKTYCVAEKWKTDIQENSKTICFHNVLPELCHNEINGYINLTTKPHVVIIKDKDDHLRVVKRMEIIKKLFERRGVEVTTIPINDDDRLSRLFSSQYLGLWVSFYLALEYKTDPTPVEIVEDLKVELDR